MNREDILIMERTMTAARKIRFDKGWINEKSGSVSRARKIAKFEQVRIVRADELPEMLSTKDAARILKRHYKTIEEYRKDGSLRFEKTKGRFYTIPEWIHDFLVKESLKK